MAKILIIDDERAIRRALREILEFEDFQVDEAENGVEGLEKAKNTLYDIIFCDIKMPQMMMSQHPTIGWNGSAGCTCFSEN